MMRTIVMQQGFSLLEVLVSILILSIGLTGVALLQAKSIRYNHLAYLRSISVSQAENMIERMKSNETALNSGLYDNVQGIPVNPACTTCTEAEMAQKDIYYWNTMNSILLPSGQGSVLRNGAQHRVTVYWDAQKTGATGTNCSNDPSVDLTCMTVEVQL